MMRRTETTTSGNDAQHGWQNPPPRLSIPMLHTDSVREREGKELVDSLIPRPAAPVTGVPISFTWQPSLTRCCTRFGLVSSSIVGLLLVSLRPCPNVPCCVSGPAQTSWLWICSLFSFPPDESRVYSFVARCGLASRRARQDLRLLRKVGPLAEY